MALIEFEEKPTPLDAFLYGAIIGIFIILAVLIGRSWPVHREVHVKRVMHWVKPADRLIPGPERLVAQNVYVKVASDDYIGPAGSCERGNPVEIVQIVQQEKGSDDNKSWMTYLKVRPVGQQNVAFCSVKGAWEDMMKVGDVVALNTGKGN